MTVVGRGIITGEPAAAVVMAPPPCRRCTVIVEERLRALGLELPPPLAVPPASACRSRRSGSSATGDRLRPRPAERGRLQRRTVRQGGGGRVGRGGVRGRAGDRPLDPGRPVRALGDLDRITAWVRVFGMVASAPGFDRQPAVINGFSDLVLDAFGPEVGAHARSAVGMAELPFGLPVEIEAEVAFAR